MLTPVLSLQDRLGAVRLALLTRHYPALLARLGASPVVFNGRMRSTAGRAYYRTNIIHLNARLFEGKAFADIEQTFVHELAHLISFALYGREGTGHGYRWRSVMLTLGYPADRCHKHDTSHLRVKQKRFAAYCQCPSHHAISSARRTKMIQGRNYRCVRCNSLLSLSKQSEVA